MHDFAIVAIAKNEERYILEWLAFHISIGVSNFVVFDNESSDRTGELLDACSHLMNLEKIHWKTTEGTSPQLGAYNHFLQNYRTIFKFAAFIDIDEFIVPINSTGLSPFIDSIPDSAGAIALNQRVFGSAGRSSYEPDLVIERFTLCSTAEYDENKYVKSIYRISNIEAICNPHLSPILSGAFLHPDLSHVEFDQTRPGCVLRIDYSKLQLNHYILKSHEEFELKRRRGGAAAQTEAARLSRYDDAFFWGREPLINKYKSEVTRPWVCPTRKILNDLERELSRYGLC